MAKYLQILESLAACVSLLVCSSTLVIINKWVMTDLEFRYPQFVGALGMAFVSIVSFVYCTVLGKVQPVPEVTWGYWATRIMPVGIAHGLAIIFGNQLYIYLTVAFLEMSRAALPVIVMLMLWASRIEVPTPTITRAVLLTAAGCAIAAYGEMHLNLLGIFFCVINLGMEAVRVVLMQHLMSGLRMHPLKTLELMAPTGTLTLLLGSAITELPDMLRNKAFGIMRTHPLPFVLVASLGLTVNILGTLIVKLSSATMLKVLVAVRGPIVVVAGVLLFGEVVTGIQLFGYSIALGGFVWYNVAQARRTIAAAAATPPVEDGAGAAAEGGDQTTPLLKASSA